MSRAVSTSLMPWPRAAKAPVSGSQKVRVPMPAMESLIHAPSRYWPSLPHWTAVAVNCTGLSSRTARMLMGVPAAAWRALCTCSMLSTSAWLMWVMMSPSRRPQSRAGALLPAGPATWEKPTTITPSEKSLMPTARPMGRTVRASAARAVAAGINDAATSITATAAASHGRVLDSSLMGPPLCFKKSARLPRQC